MNETGATTSMLLHLPSRGLCQGTLVAELRARGGAGDFRWLILRFAGQGHLAVQIEVPEVDGWRRERATAWWVPPILEPIDDGLREVTDPARIRARLGAGLAEARLLFDEEVDRPLHGDDEDLDDSSPIRWRPSTGDEVPSELHVAAFRASAAWAKGQDIDLDTGNSEGLAEATAEGVHYHNGVGVLGWEAARLVISVVFAEQEALLVAEVHATEGQTYEELLAQDRVSLRLVPRAGPADAERVVLEHEPGLRLLTEAPSVTTTLLR